FWVTTVTGGVNSQKSHSAIFKALIFHLRHNPAAGEILGSNIAYDPSRHDAVEGTVNMMKGRADIQFRVGGDRGDGIITFRGRRAGDDWISDVFTLAKGDKTISLRDD
ncbi:cytochrome oxidase assembly protein 1, partial [Blyttiomyces helicus]